MFRAKESIDFTTESLLAKMNLERNGLVQQAIDTAVINYCVPYVPNETGVLAGSAYTASGGGKVIYPGPYAHYMYYGVVYGPNIPLQNSETGAVYWRSPKGKKKHPTGRAIQYHAPGTTSFWFEHMKADHLDDIIREAKGVVGK